MKTKTIDYGSSGLSYVRVTVPVRSTSQGEVVAIPLARIEEAVARALIEKGIPLRGAEVAFLRKALGLSLALLGNELGVSAPAVLKWERAHETRLHPMNEVALRALVAEHFGLPLAGHFSVLLGCDKAPATLRLRVA
jgi:DNA-binding transcriptional regulator YiaG